MELWRKLLVWLGIRKSLPVSESIPERLVSDSEVRRFIRKYFREPLWLLEELSAAMAENERLLVKVKLESKDTLIAMMTSYLMTSIPGIHIGIVSPNSEQSCLLRDNFELKFPIRHAKVNTRNRIELENGSKLSILSMTRLDHTDLMFLNNAEYFREEMLPQFICASKKMVAIYVNSNRLLLPYFSGYKRIEL